MECRPDSSRQLSIQVDRDQEMRAPLKYREDAARALARRRCTAGKIPVKETGAGGMAPGAAEKIWTTAKHARLGRLLVEGFSNHPGT